MPDDALASADPLDVGTGTPEHTTWLASAERGALLRDVEVAGGWFPFVAGNRLQEVHFCHKGRFAACCAGKATVREAVRHQIELDLTRTFPTEVDQHLVARLSTVLHAFAVHDPRVGYCQGMNFITAVCLRYMTDEQAFWVMAYMAERLFPDYFIDMEGAVADKSCLDWLLARSLPAVAAQFERFDGLPAVLWQALLCVFANNIMPSEAVLVLWAAIFQHGRVHLLRLLCQLVLHCQDAIAAAATADELQRAVSHRLLVLFDAGPLVRAVAAAPAPDPRGGLCWLTLSSPEIWKKRDELVEVYKEDMTERREGIQVIHLARATKLPPALLQRWCDEFHLLLLQQRRHSPRRLEAPPTDGMDLHAFQQVMAHLGCDDHMLNLSKLFELWNASHTASLTFSELVTGLVELSDTTSLEARLHMCFASYDIDGSGTLEVPEVQTMMYSRYWSLILMDGREGGPLFSPDGTISCAQFCAAMADCPSLPAPLRHGLALPNVRLYCVLRGREPRCLPLLIGNTVKTLGSELGKALDARTRHLHPVLGEVAHTTLQSLSTLRLEPQPPPMAPAPAARLTGKQAAVVHALLCAPPFPCTVYGSVLWEPCREQPTPGLTLQRYLPRGPIGVFFDSIRLVHGDAICNYRLVATATTPTVLAHAQSDEDAELLWAWAAQLLRTPQDVAWHLDAYRWLPGATVARAPGPETVAELRAAAEALAECCDNAEQLWQFYHRVKEGCPAAVAAALQPVFLARLPVLFQQWVERLHDPREIEAISEALRAWKPAYDAVDSTLADLALNRVEELLALALSPTLEAPQ